MFSLRKYLICADSEFRPNLRLLRSFVDVIYFAIAFKFTLALEFIIFHNARHSHHTNYEQHSLLDV